MIQDHKGLLDHLFQHDLLYNTAHGVSMLVLSAVLLSRLRTSRTALLWDTSAQTEPLPAALPASCGASGCRTEVRCSRCSCCQHLARTSTPLVPQHSDSPGARALRKITLRVPLLFQQSSFSSFLPSFFFFPNLFSFRDLIVSQVAHQVHSIGRLEKDVLCIDE